MKSQLKFKIGIGMAKIMCAIKKNRENNLFPYDAKYTYVHDVCYFGETLFIQPVVDVYYCCRSTVFFSSLGRAADRKICHFIWKSLDPKFIVIPFGKCGPRNRLERNRNSTTRRRTLSTKWKEEYYSLSYLVSVHFCSPLAPSHVCSHQNKSCLFSSFWCD